MIDEALRRLERANPVVDELATPPIDEVLRRIAAEPAASGSRRLRWRLPGLSALVPVLGVAAALAVAVIAVVLVHGHRASTTSSVTTPGRTLPGTIPSAPRGGMRGVVSLQAAAFPAGGAGIISLQQCWPCHAAPRGGEQKWSDWLATSRDGAHWTILPRRWIVFAPRFSGTRDGWAMGLSLTKQTAGFYATHDGGETWRRVPSASPAFSVEHVAVAGGAVWAIGDSCAQRCQVTVMRASASASALPATPGQPVSGDDTNLQPVAVSARTAYVLSNRSGHQFVTHDGGRSWSRVAPPCDGGSWSVPTAGGASSVWTSCVVSNTAAVLRRSTDGGSSWQTRGKHIAPLFDLEASSSQVAWALTVHGHVMRTTDGGATWSTVWTVGGSQPARLAGHTPLLASARGDDATVVVSLTSGHVGKQARYTNLVVYRTTDAGASWIPSVVRLPSR